MHEAKFAGRKLGYCEACWRQAERKGPHGVMLCGVHVAAAEALARGVRARNALELLWMLEETDLGPRTTSFERVRSTAA